MLLVFSIWPSKMATMNGSLTHDKQTAILVGRKKSMRNDESATRVRGVVALEYGYCFRAGMFKQGFKMIDGYSFLAGNLKRIDGNRANAYYRALYHYLCR